MSICRIPPQSPKMKCKTLRFQQLLDLLFITVLTPAQVRALSWIKIILFLIS